MGKAEEVAVAERRRNFALFVCVFERERASAYNYLGRPTQLCMGFGLLLRFIFFLLLFTLIILFVFVYIILLTEKFNKLLVLRTSVCVLLVSTNTLSRIFIYNSYIQNKNYKMS